MRMNDFSLETLLKQEVKQLYAYARELGVPDFSNLSKKELALAVMRHQEEKQGFFKVEGILDLSRDQNSLSFIRPINFSPSSEDIYISDSQIRRFSLRNGDRISGPARPPKENERYSGLMQISAVNGQNPEKMVHRDHFASLAPIYPDRPLHLSYAQEVLSNRLIDLISPVGFGQRGMIVAPPKAGKTTLLKEIARGIRHNYPKTHLFVLLIDERPEEVTDFERFVEGEVVASTFDQTPSNHIRVASLLLAHAQRLVESGEDVVILLDSITRLARAYNLVVKPSGRTLTGGFDPAAFYFPKRFFGSARNIENGGSLTILATALVDTGSRMDEIIYEEFKGTGNMELHLSRELANRRIFPALDIKNSSTRREEYLMDDHTLDLIWRLRKGLGRETLEITDQLIQLLSRSEDQISFLQALEKLLPK